MVACQVCYSLFQTPTKIARIRSNEYVTSSNGDDADIRFFSRDHMPIDVLINPERCGHGADQGVAKNIPGRYRWSTSPSGGCNSLPCAPTTAGRWCASNCARSVNTSPRSTPRSWRSSATAGRSTPTAKTVIEVDDEVFFIAPAEDINAVHVGIQARRAAQQAGHHRRRRQYRPTAGTRDPGRLRRQGRRIQRIPCRTGRRAFDQRRGDPWQRHRSGSSDPGERPGYRVRSAPLPTTTR